VYQGADMTSGSNKEPLEQAKEDERFPLSLVALSASSVLESIAKVKRSQLQKQKRSSRAEDHDASHSCLLRVNGAAALVDSRTVSSGLIKILRNRPSPPLRMRSSSAPATTSPSRRIDWPTVVRAG
jgi:hypothetical protein